VINLNGTWEKEHPKVTGELSLRAGLDGCIFTTKRGSGTIVRFNIDTGKREHYQFRIFIPCGIAIKQINILTLLFLGDQKYGHNTF
jgi:hypothetical protein